MHHRIREIYVPVFVRIRAADENKILFVLYDLLQDLPAVYEALPQESLFIISGRADADQ